MKMPIRKAITVIFAVNMIATLAACSSQPTQSKTDSTPLATGQTTSVSKTVTAAATTESEYSSTPIPDTTTGNSSTQTEKVLKPEPAPVTTPTQDQLESTTAPATTAEPKWKETEKSAEMFLNASVYSRTKAYIGAPTADLYNINDKVKVVAVTDTDYYKLSDGNYIHKDYLSNEKTMIQTTAATTAATTVAATTAQSTPLPQTSTVKSETSVSPDTPDPSEKYDSYTSSGYKPLDDIIFPILDEIITRDMTESDKCLAVYDYLLKYDYIERTLLIPESKKKYTEQLYAISLFENKYGECYDFSAAFKFMTRAVGVDTLMYYGQHSSYHSPSGYIPHTWDVIERDGVPYIYDIAMERITMDAGRENSYHCRYGITYEGFPGYYYIPETFTR